MAVYKNRWKGIINEAQAAADLAIQDTANFILTMIRIYAPVKTGWLRDSYKKEEIGYLHILIGSMVHYSIHQEYGTYKMMGRAHLRPAFWQAAPYFDSAFKSRLKDLG